MGGFHKLMILCWFSRMVQHAAATESRSEVNAAPGGPRGRCGGRGGGAVGTGSGTETGRMRCDWGLGILAFPDSGFLLSLTLSLSLLSTASFRGWGPPSSHPGAGRWLSVS